MPRANRPEKLQRTYQARLADPDGSLETVPGAYATRYGQAERALFADLAAGCEPAALKSSYLIRFGLTARQFNAIAINLKGKIAAIKERRTGLIDEAKARIKRAQQVIAKLDKDLSNDTDKRQRLSAKRHQQQRRLARLQARLAQMEAGHAKGTVRLCFGGRKRFRGQFNLEANGYGSHEEWREDWQRARASQFVVIGSKGETTGCQGCVIEPSGGQRFALRLRLPHAQCQDGEKSRRIEIALAYGAETIHAALEAKQAISYRFQRDAKGWRVFITTQARPVQQTSRRLLGVIGIDLNGDHLALCETDRHGNPIASRTVALCTDGLGRHQTQARIGEAIKAMMAFAEGKDKPLAIEQLDFAKKKQRSKRCLPAMRACSRPSPTPRSSRPSKPAPMTRASRSSPATRPTLRSSIGPSSPSATASAPIMPPRW